MPDSNHLLNVHQVAGYLQLNLSTVYQWAQQGRIPAIKLGGCWRFRKADLDRWLDEQTRRPKISSSAIDAALDESTVLR